MVCQQAGEQPEALPLQYFVDWLLAFAVEWTWGIKGLAPGPRLVIFRVS